MRPDHPAVVVLLTILVLSDGDFGRIGLTVRASWRMLRDPCFAE